MWRLLPRPSLGNPSHSISSMTIEFGAVSETGPVRAHNEDFVGHFVPDDAAERDAKGCLFLVCDGVGGSEAGEVASRECVQTLLKYYGDDTSSRPDRALKTGVEMANMRVFDLGQANRRSKMKTTLAALLLVGESAHLGSVGDTRIYLLRGGELRQLTRDHSEVEELVRLGIISRDEARHHPRRNIITRALGGELMIQADFRVEKVEVGDVFLLLTDGIWEPLEDAVLTQVLAGHSPPQACAELLRLAVEGGSSDNLSAQVVRVVALGEAAPAQPKRGLLGRLLGR